jgi:hypothetical protein
MNKPFSVICIFLFLVSCGNNKVKEEETYINETEIPMPGSDTTPVTLNLEKFKWLEGNWSFKNKDGSFSFENWKKKDDSTMAGKSYVISGKDTVFSEIISLEQRNSRIRYVPTLRNQNGGKPIPFELMSFGPGILVFENPEHDFPTRIQYVLVGTDSLIAEISGKKNGKKTKEVFPFIRTK